MKLPRPRIPAHGSFCSATAWVRSRPSSLFSITAATSTASCSPGQARSTNLLRPPALCFPQLQPASFRSFLAAAPRLSDAHALSSIRADLPIYLFSGSEDPVAYSGKASELSSGASARRVYMTSPMISIVTAGTKC